MQLVVLMLMALDLETGCMCMRAGVEPGITSSYNLKYIKYLVKHRVNTITYVNYGSLIATD